MHRSCGGAIFMLCRITRRSPVILVVSREDNASQMHYLYFGTDRVGSVDQVFEHQGTWFGQLQLLANSNVSHNSERLLSFIDFCAEWYSKQNSDDPPDASAFDAFPEFLAHGSWSIHDALNAVSAIADAPMFLDGRRGEISWIQLDRK